MPDKEPLDYMTSVDFTFKNSNGSKPYHLLYGSQLYNTLFAIYGKFTFEFDTTGDICYLQRIDFKLLNYKGTVNLGFTKEEILGNDKEDNLYVFVQGLKRKRLHAYAFTNPIELKKGERRHIILNRILNPLKGETFDAQTRVITSQDYDFLEIDEGKRAFDNEFKYRDGTGFLDRPLHPGMLGYERTKKTKDDKSIVIGSPRCHQSNVMLKF